MGLKAHTEVQNTVLQRNLYGKTLLLRIVPSYDVRTVAEDHCRLRSPRELRCEVILISDVDCNGDDA